MAERGHCEHPECDRSATRTVQVADMIRAVACCDEHAADFRECAGESCHRLAQVVIAIGARDSPPREGAREQLWLCTDCADAVRQAPTLTLEGRRFINDRAGWLIPMPPTVGRG
jgi:hypothetical protein